MNKVAYIFVRNTPLGTFSDSPGPEGNVYTREVLKNALQLLGCKARHAYKTSHLVFVNLEEQIFNLGRRGSKRTWQIHHRHGGTVWVSIPRSEFDSMVLDSVASCMYKGNLAEDWKVATSVCEKRRSVTVLLCGTSGTGKSTLASLVATRLGITTLLSTDSVRHMLRSYSTAEENPLLFASTYQAGDAFDGERAIGLEGLSEGKRTVKGYKAQSEMVLEKLGSLIEQSESRNQSMVVEGVHLSLNFVVRLMKKHKSIVPFLIHINNEQKHKERFAVRSKYMTTDPARNKYVKYLKNIRIIQDYLTRKADKHLIPTMDNTNVDRSLAIIHATVFGCLRRMTKGEAMLCEATNTVKTVNAEFLTVKETMSWRGKDMLEMIRSKASREVCTPSTSSSAHSTISDTGEDIDDDFDAQASIYSHEVRVMSSDPDDELSTWGDSSDDELDAQPIHNAEECLGSVWESTDLDWDDHDD